MKNEVFISRKENKVAGFNLLHLLGRVPVDGDIGIEIEVEGNKFPKHQTPDNESVSPELIPKEWQYHHDGSLRGNDNAEYVFRKPLAFADVPQAIKNLWEMFDKFGSKLDESNRTSVHVHLNAQEWHLNRLTAFAALYFSVEEILTEWCGDHRVGNLFCLRAKDAPAIVSQLKKFIQNDGNTGLPSGLHYAGLNPQALLKFGSIEIRSLRGVTDPDTILTWVAILERIYNMSADFKDPRTICSHFSGHGAMSYLEMILGEHTPTVLQQVSYDHQQIQESLYEGIRLAQDLCYCRNWSEYEPVEIKKDPFGRKITNVVDQISQAQAAGEWTDSISAAQQLHEYWSTANILTTASTPIYIPAPPAPVEEEPEDDWVEDYEYFEEDEE